MPRDRRDHAGEVEERVEEAIAQRLADERLAFIAFIERRVGSRALAEDLFQEAFARGLDRIPTLRDSESAVAWFYRILRNAVADHYRRERSSSRRLEAFESELSRAEAATDREGELHEVVCQCVARLAGDLKPEYAEAIRRVEIDGVAVKDFAEEAGITNNNAGVRIHRARAALRKKLMDSCGSCAAEGCFNCVCGTRGEG